MVMKCMNFQHRVKFSVNMGEEKYTTRRQKTTTHWVEKKHRRQSKKKIKKRIKEVKEIV